MKYMLIILTLLLLLPTVQAVKDSNITLLAVIEKGDELIGAEAMLELEIVPGHGRVFLDTSQLSKLDTQMSMRFAKEMACSYIKKDCSNYDFIYTIMSASSIVGGPSAGAAATALTIASLNEWDLDPSVVITGTINSGGIIGPVGGVKEKIESAAANGIRKVLIPLGTRYYEEDNQTIDLVKYGKTKGLLVEEVWDLNEAMWEFTGIKQEKITGDLTIDEDYLRIMKNVSEMLCGRTEKLLDDATEFEETNETTVFLNASTELYDKSLIASEIEDYYTAASYCFGANVKASQFILLSKNESDLVEKQFTLAKNIDTFHELILNKKIETINDLQTLMIVQDRIDEAKKYLEESAKTNDTQLAKLSLAYSLERFNSAITWANFFQLGGVELNIDTEIVKKACLNKLTEANDRYNYVSYFFPQGVELVKERIQDAAKDSVNGDYTSCLFRAGKAKAQSDAVLMGLGVNEEQLNDVVAKKLEIVKQAILKQQSLGMFPILGVSYYEYSNSLKEEDPYSALLYTEYALELSNLNMYFEEWPMIDNRKFNVGLVIALFAGVVIGLFLRKVFEK